MNSTSSPLVVRSRFSQFTLIASTLGYCWLGMQIVHELGHVLAACSVSVTVKKVALHPLILSRTDASHDQYPLVVIWGGPAVGSLLPLGLMAFSRLLRCRLFYLFQFFAGFCLIANGVYLGVGSFGGVGDAGDLIRHGSPRWTLIAFGLICTPLGLWLWNGLGPHFGLGKSKGEVDRTAMRWAVGVVLMIVVLELLFASR